MKLKDEESAQVGETYLSCIWPSKHNIQITEKVTLTSQQGETKEPTEKWARAEEAIHGGGSVRGRETQCHRAGTRKCRTEVRRKHCFPAIRLADVNEHGNVPAKMSEREFARCL